MITVELRGFGQSDLTPEEAVAIAQEHAKKAQRAIWISIAVSAVLWLIEYKVMGGWVREMRWRHEDMQELLEE